MNPEIIIWFTIGFAASYLFSHIRMNAKIKQSKQRLDDAGDLYAEAIKIREQCQVEVPEELIESGMQSIRELTNLIKEIGENESQSNSS